MQSSTVCTVPGSLYLVPMQISAVFTIPGKVRACTCALYDNGGKGN
jgi:hypothetical protein